MPDEPPQPLQMSADDVKKVADHVGRPGRLFEPTDRLLLEILDCLRAIDDKLQRLIDRADVH